MSSASTAAAAASGAALNPRTTRYEFLGPPGAVGFVTALPLLVLFFAVCCDNTGYPSKSFLADPKGFLSSLWTRELADKFLDPLAVLVYFAFIGLLVVFYLVLSCDVVPGTKLRDGSVLKYRLNGFSTFCNLVIVSGLLANHFGPDIFLFVYDHWLGLVGTSIVFSYVISLYLYIRSFHPGALLSLGGNSGNPIYDFVMGRELNPRIGDFDIKFFTELRPGLLGWIWINFCFAYKQYHDLNRVTNSMILVLAFHTFYVADALWNEEKVLTTIDITSEGAGYMLMFGLYSWLPMTYTIQARYLVDFPRDLSNLEFSLICGLCALGYYIFRSANSQKNEFRTNPESDKVKHLKYLKTERGTKLIISGWWGVSRHINYFGDWLIALAGCLPCGYGSVIPYFYAIYFAVLLLHRERRDDHACRLKYGKDWDKYCSIVKYRIIPGIY